MKLGGRISPDSWFPGFRLPLEIGCPRAGLQDRGRHPHSRHGHERAVSRGEQRGRRIRAAGRRVSRLGPGRRLHALFTHAGPVSSLCLAGLSLGTPHAHRAAPQAARRGDRLHGRGPGPRRSRLGVSRRSGVLAGSGERFCVSQRGLPRLQYGLSRTLDGARALGQADEADREQLGGRHLPDVQLGVSRRGTRHPGPVSAGSRGGAERIEPAHLRTGEQRRVPRGLRHEAGGV